MFSVNMMSILFSLAVTAKTQSKISPLDKLRSSTNLKTSIGALAEGFNFSISLHSQRSMQRFAASADDYGEKFVEHLR
jgi:hypothetical protein